MVQAVQLVQQLGFLQEQKAAENSVITLVVLKAIFIGMDRVWKTALIR